MYTVTESVCTPPGPGYRYLHWHEDLQFTLVRNGSCTIQVNGVPYTLHAGEAIFINSGSLHMTSQIHSGGTYVSFNFPSRFLSFFPGSRLEQDYVLPFVSNYRFPARQFFPSILWEQELILKLCDLCELCASDTYAKEYAIALKTAELWLHFIRHIYGELPKVTASIAHNQEKMQSMLALIHKNYASDLSLNDIAKAAHISPGDCCRSFKKVLHTTPYRYLLEFRILKSADLLKETSHSVAEVAGMAGFNDSSHFIQFFKRQMGMTPSEYRTNLRLISNHGAPGCQSDSPQR